MVQGIVTDDTSKNTGTNRAPWRVIRNGIYGTNPVQSEMSGTSTPAYSGISGTSADTPSGGLCIPRIGNIRQSSSPNFRNSDGLNADVDRNLSNDPIVPPISTQVFGQELSDSSRRDIYTCFRVNLAKKYLQPMGPQFVNHGISIIHRLNKSSGIWSPDTKIRMSPDITNVSALDNYVGLGASCWRHCGWQIRL